MNPIDQQVRLRKLILVDYVMNYRHVQALVLSGPARGLFSQELADEILGRLEGMDQVLHHKFAEAVATQNRS